MKYQKFVYAYSIHGFNSAVNEYLDLGYTVIPHTIVFTRLDNTNYFSVFLNPPVNNTYSGPNKDFKPFEDLKLPGAQA